MREGLLLRWIQGVEITIDETALMHRFATFGFPLRSACQMTWGPRRQRFVDRIRLHLRQIWNVAMSLDLFGHHRRTVRCAINFQPISGSGWRSRPTS
jgi:hypothetical protein